MHKHKTFWLWFEFVYDTCMQCTKCTLHIAQTDLFWFVAFGFDWVVNGMCIFNHCRIGKKSHKFFSLTFHSFICLKQWQITKQDKWHTLCTRSHFGSHSQPDSVSQCDNGKHLFYFKFLIQFGKICNCGYSKKTKNKNSVEFLIKSSGERNGWMKPI